MKKQWMTADPIEYALLKNNAKNNRESMTEAEKVFWTLVKGNAFGERCLRQHVIGDYIVDFLFRRSRLVVEIDGGYHSTREQQELDSLRTGWLEEMGFSVIRFTNEQVLFDTDNTMNKLRVQLNKLSINRE